MGNGIEDDQPPHGGLVPEDDEPTEDPVDQPEDDEPASDE